MRLVIFSLAAAIAMWVLGFIFYGLLFDVGWATAPEATQLAIQAALKALPHSGTYVVPMGGTPAMVQAYAAGPVAQISYNAGGYPMADPLVFVGGFVQFFVVALMIGWLLRGLGDRVDVIGRVRVVLGMAAVAAVYIDLADPIWMRGDWRHALFTAGVDFIILGIGGLIMARWFVLRRVSSIR